jgi:hypothetical protein
MRLASSEGEAPDDSLRSNLDDIFVDYVMSKRRESPEIDFKLILDASRERFAELAKDIFAMSNYGGGYIVAGVKEKESGGFEYVGLPQGFHIDQADLQQKFNSYSQEPIALGYREFDYRIGENILRFAIAYVPPSTKPLKPQRDGTRKTQGGKEKVLFKSGDLLVRRGTQSIKANAEESEYIEKRSEESGYSLSLISGNPDRTQETLYSNLFEVRRTPSRVYSATLALEQITFATTLLAPFVTQGQTLYSFRDLTEEPLARLVKPGTVGKHNTSEWMKDKDRRNIVLWLLDSSLIWEAGQFGMFVQRKGKRLYFPLRQGETTRFEKWPGLVRKSTRQVATMMYASQLGESVGVHAAVSVHFMLLGERIFLRLSPTYVLTSDGRRIRSGQEEGSVITRLSHDDYNMIYLRNLLFWVSRLGGAKDKFAFESGQIEVDVSPVTSKIDFGIRSDRCSLESIESDVTGQWSGDRGGD